MAGVIELSNRAASSFYEICGGLYDDEYQQSRFRISLGLIGLLQFSWHIAGSVWVFGIWYSVDFKDESSKHHCDETAYMFSFVLLLLGWVSIPMSCCIEACICLYGTRMGGPRLSSWQVHYPTKQDILSARYGMQDA